MDATYTAAYGHLYRQHWWWRVREEILLRKISRILTGRSTTRILDVGCGAGLFFDKLNTFGHVEGIESDRLAVEDSGRWKDRIHIGELATFKSPRPFDLILMLDVLEHVNDPDALIRHATSLLTPGGAVLVTVPAFDWLWTGHDDLNHHVKRYTAAKMCRLLRDSGLEVVGTQYLFQSLILAKTARPRQGITVGIAGYRSTCAAAPAQSDAAGLVPRRAHACRLVAVRHLCPPDCPASRPMNDRTRNALVAIVVVLVPLPFYLLRLDHTVGLMVDDASYIMLARALALGDGYRLVNSPFPHILPLYPPAFPALLSLVFHAVPGFPANVWLLKSVSIAAMLGVGMLSYVYLHRDRGLPRHLAACASIAIATTPAFVFLATSTVMSECVFTLAQLGAVVVADRAVTVSGKHTGRLVVFGAVLAAVAVLIRSAGAGLLLAACLCFLKERRWARAAGFATAAVLCLLPWLLHTRAHQPTPAEQEAHRGSIVFAYPDQFWMRRAGSVPSGRITIAELPDRVATNLLDVFARGVGGILVPTLLRGPDESGEEIVSLGGEWTSERSASATLRQIWQSRWSWVGLRHSGSYARFGSE